MSANLEDRLRRHFERVTDDIELPERTFDPHLSSTDQRSMTRSSRQGRGLMVAAAAVLTVGAVGLIATRRADAPAPATPPPSTQPAASRLLAGAVELSPSDWVTATVLPDGVEWLFADRRWYIGDGQEDNRAIAYGHRVSDGTGEELWIEVGATAATSSSSVVDAAGIEWELDERTPGWWSATRSVGDTTVNVRGQGIVDAALLAGLIVVDEMDLPHDPLGGPDEATEVARATLDDAVYAYGVQESNDYYCNWLDDGTGAGSGGCGGFIQPDAAITIDGGSTEQIAGADIVTAVRAGSVLADAERVEVDFADGTTLTVEPTDLSGQFDRRFWVAAATISTESLIGIPVTGETVGEVRAYDTNDNLLGTTRPPWVPDDTAAPLEESEESDG